MVNLSRDSAVTRTTPISHGKRVIYHGKLNVPCKRTQCFFTRPYSYEIAPLVSLQMGNIGNITETSEIGFDRFCSQK